MLPSLRSTLPMADIQVKVEDSACGEATLCWKDIKVVSMSTRALPSSSAGCGGNSPPWSSPPSTEIERLPQRECAYYSRGSSVVVDVCGRAPDEFRFASAWQ